MTEPTFLAIPLPQWQIINSFALWISALATFTASGVSLYIALRGARQRASLSVGPTSLIIQGKENPISEIVSIEFVNKGERAINVTNVGWRTGLINKRFAVQGINQTAWSDTVPVTVQYGERVSWHIPLEAQEGWYQYFANGFVRSEGAFDWWDVWTLRFVAYSSTGREFVCRPEKELRQKIRAAMTPKPEDS